MSAAHLPRDFIETSAGLVFAVVDGRPEAGRVLGFLRYVREDGRLRKLRSAEADAWLAGHAPEYRFRSSRLDAPLHGVPLDRIARHYRPRERVRELLAAAPRDVIEARAVRWLRLMEGQGLDLAAAGITGSVLIGAQNPASDLDFVLYGREAFFATRQRVGELIQAGELAAPDAAAWREAYARRGCALGFEEWLDHERRKLNKGLIEGTKFDITLLTETDPPTGPFRKLGPAILRAEVADAARAFDFPAVYRLRHPEAEEAWSFTQTYAGQAEAGETVEIAGHLEAGPDGRVRIIVGSSREAPGEWIRRVSGSAR
jgi:predicted nucleotidyltransferase